MFTISFQILPHSEYSVTVEELDFNHTHTNWTDFWNWNLHNIYQVKKDDIVFIDHDDNDIMYHFKNIMEKTSKRTIANYLAWRLALMSLKFLNDDLRFSEKIPSRMMSSLSVDCVKQTMELYVIIFVGNTLYFAI